MNRKIIISVIFTLLVGLIIWYFFGQKQPEKYTGPVEKIRLGTAAQGPDFSLLISVAQDQGYFESNGLDVLDISSPTTLEIQQGLDAGELDLGVSTEFAYLTAISGADPLKAKIVAVIDKGQTIKMVVRKDRGISAPADLKGKKIAVFKKTPQEYFLGTFLASNNLNLEDVQLTDLPPANAKDAILEGEVDAAVMSGQYVYQASKSLAAKAVIWPIQGNINFNWIVMGGNQFIQNHPKTLERFLKALIQAEEYVQKNPDKSQELLTKKFNLEQPYLVSMWPENEYIVSLDQTLLLLMENETRWAIANKLIKETKVPNYLDFIYFDALEKVEPEAVNIIH